MALAVLGLTGSATADGQTSPSPPVGPQVQQPSANGPAPAKTAIRYSADFFAGKNAKTAFDMVNSLPGFTFSAETFRSEAILRLPEMCSSTASALPTSNFALDTVLQHIPTEQVEYIEVIEGAQTGPGNARTNGRRQCRAQEVSREQHRRYLVGRTLPRRQEYAVRNPLKSQGTAAADGISREPYPPANTSNWPRETVLKLAETSTAT